MPGDFMRRFDKLYRMGIEQGKEDLVVNAMKEVAAKAGIATVTGTIGNVEQRDHDDEKRYFKGKNGKVVETTDKNRKAFTKEQIYEQIWHEPTNNHLHAVENTIFQIRKRLKPYCMGHEYIKTVIGYGYKFNSE